MKTFSAAFCSLILGFSWPSATLSQTPATQAAAGMAQPTTSAVSVPSLCAAFMGAWSGDWGFGKRMLWVREIDGQCVAKYTYGAPKTAPIKFAEIEKDVLSFPCGKSGGSCSFTVHGDELWGRYGGSDGFNNTVFKRIPTPVMAN